LSMELRERTRRAWRNVVMVVPGGGRRERL
jgi:hypothetical protein